MRRTLLTPMVALLIAGAAAGCATSPGGGGPTPTPTKGPQCPTGTWRGTSVEGTTNLVGVAVILQRGADVKLTIGADGAITADFTEMKPVTFSADLGGTQAAGELTYQGKSTAMLMAAGASATPGGTMSIAPSGGPTSADPMDPPPTTPVAPSGSPRPTASASPAGPAGQPWRVTQVSWAGLTVTVVLTKPLPATIVDKMKVEDVTTGQLAQVTDIVDLRPLLRDGEFRCDGNDKLVVTPAGTPTTVWTFARTS
jgi:hypothetical protein